jgi:hypothetical protein
VRLVRRLRRPVRVQLARRVLRPLDRPVSADCGFDRGTPVDNLAGAVATTVGVAAEEVDAAQPPLTPPDAR